MTASESSYAHDLRTFRENLKQEIVTLKKIALKKRLSYYLFSTFLPYYWGLYGMIKLINLVSPKKGALRLAGFLHHYFKFYFFFKGIRLQPTVFPKASDKPSVFIVPRINLYSPLFLYRAIPWPVIVPVVDNFNYYRVVCFLDLPFIGKVIQTVSYSEGHLGANFANISTLVRHGYDVVVHANQDFSEGAVFSRPELYQSLLEVLALDADIYFVKIPGIERFRFSTFFSPLPVSMSFHTKKDVLPEAPQTADELLKTLAKFWDMKDYKSI